MYHFIRHIFSFIFYARNSVANFPPQCKRGLSFLHLLTFSLMSFKFSSTVFLRPFLFLLTTWCHHLKIVITEPHFHVPHLLWLSHSVTNHLKTDHLKTATIVLCFPICRSLKRAGSAGGYYCPCS